MKITSRLAARLVLLLLAVALPAAAQTFGTEKKLFAHSVPSISYDPYVQAAGTSVYVAWAEFSSATGRQDIMVVHSTDNGTTFSAPVNVSNAGATAGVTTAVTPVIVGDGTNVLVFWTEDVSGENPAGANQHIGRIFYARSTNNGASFGAPAVLVDQPGYSRPTSAIISGSQVHLVFYDNRVMTGASIAGRVYHIMSCNSGATWNVETNVNQFDGDVDNEQPRLAQLSTGQIFLSFRSSRAGIPQAGHPPFQVYLLRMNTAGCPSGATWLRPAQRLTRGSDVEMGGNYAANIFAGASGGLHALWWSDNAGTNLQYRYGKPDGNGFGAQQDLSQFGLNHLQWTGLSEVTGYGFGEDASGKLHAMFLQNGSTRVDFQTGNLWYRCAPSPVGSAFLGKKLATGGLASEPRGFYNNGRFHMVWMDFRGTSTNQAEIWYNFVDTTTACTAPPAVVAPVPSESTVDFGANSMMTTSSGQTFQLTNGGSSAITITSFTAPTGFAVSSTDCATLASGASCNVTVTFTPQAVGTVTGNLVVAYNAGGPTLTSPVQLTGVSEQSLVIHYYRAILNRAPDAAGKAFWDGEAARMGSLGADLREAYFVMANYFFNSPEYQSYGKNDAQFVTDLYNTFFNRPPDGPGLSFWTGQIAGGLPRDVVLFSFMFSPEFQTFTTGIFGNTAARPEVNVVMDFFRGILNRLPDSAAFNFWVGQLRAAQCQSPGAVYDAVNNMSFSFIFGAEYTNRARTNSQYVTDLYNAFLRRGGDTAGVNFWIDQLNTAAKDRNTERTDFIASPEFAARVNDVVNAGCLP